MPARWLLFATFCLGLGVALLGAAWTASPIQSSVDTPPTVAAPMVLTVEVRVVVTATITPIPTLFAWAKTATALPTSTPRPIQPTKTPTPPFNQPMTGGSETR